jgi:hypothetical protein
MKYKKWSLEEKLEILSFQKNWESLKPAENTVLVQALYIAGRRNTTAKEDGLKVTYASVVKS